MRKLLLLLSAVSFLSSLFSTHVFAERHERLFNDAHSKSVRDTVINISRKQRQLQRDEDKRHLQPLECTENEFLFRIELDTDDFGYETYWELRNETRIILAGGDSSIIYDDTSPTMAYGEATTYVDSICLSDDNKYEFQIYDAAKDGICCSFGEGKVVLLLEDVPDEAGETNWSTVEWTAPPFQTSLIVSIENGQLIERSFPLDEQPIPSPNSSVDFFDGSFEDCIDNEEDYLQFLLMLTTDGFAMETLWDIQNAENGEIVASATDNEELFPLLDGRSYEIKRCLPRTTIDGNAILYKFTIYDVSNDGICCSYGEGSYAVIVDGQTLFASSGIFQSQDSVSFRSNGEGGVTAEGGGGNEGSETDFGEGNGDGEDDVNEGEAETSIVGPVNENHDDDLSQCQEHAFQLDLTTDGYPGETTWEITLLLYSPESMSSDAVVLESITEGQGSNQTATLCLPFLVQDEERLGGNLFYQFTIHDSWGDGICCGHGEGSYTLTFDGIPIKTGGSFEYSESTILDKIDCNSILEYKFELILATDEYGYETSWDVRDNFGTVHAHGDGYSSSSVFREAYCLPKTNAMDEELLYKFTVADSIGDGMCCKHGLGGYTLLLDGNSVVEFGGQFERSDSTFLTESFADPDAFVNCNGHRFQLNLLTDNYPRETSWRITDSLDNLVASSESFQYAEPETAYESRVCLPNNDTYLFMIYDVVGDGICCGLFGDGTYSIIYDEEVVANGGDFGSHEGFFLGDPFETSLPASERPCEGRSFELDLITDGFPLETTWELEDLSTSQIVATGGNYSEELTLFKERHCLLSEGPFRLTIHDKMSDGLCCEYGRGSYSVVVDGNLIAAGSEYGNTEVVLFGDFSNFGQFRAHCTNGHAFQLELVTDNFPSETYWDLTDEYGDVVSTGTGYKGIDILYEEYRCLPLGPQYLFTIYDSFGDGICCSSISGSGEYSVRFDGIPVFTGGDFDTQESTFLSDEFTLPTPPPDTCDDGFDLFELSLIEDEVPWESSWELLDIDGEAIFASGDYYSQSSYCLPSNRTYKFTINDLGEDGLCCLYGEGSYTLKLNGNVVGYGGEFEKSESVVFGAFSGSDEFRAECDGDAFALSLLTDLFPAETYWDIKDSLGAIVSSGSGYDQPATRYTDFRCIHATSSTYSFTMYDQFGDGICCSQENGFGEYSIAFNDTQWTFDGKFSSSETTDLILV